MTSSRRWYQLSLLQMLVAMSVVAVFTIKNTSYQTQSTDNDIGLIRAGWPCTFLDGYGTLATTTSEFVRAGDPIFAGMPKYDPWMMTLNIAICGLSTLAATRVVSLMAR